MTKYEFVRLRRPFSSGPYVFHATKANLAVYLTLFRT